MKPSKTKREQLTVNLRTSYNTKSQLVHLLVAQTFIDNPSNKKYITHKDGNPLNNDISNLLWVNPSEYTRMALQKQK